LAINLCFGLLSVFDFNEITNGTTLAMLVTGFIGLYWLSRVLIQFLYFDRSNFPEGRWNIIGEIVLVVLFIFLCVVYSVTCYFNYQRN
jgi:surface polysaccharide O-acyltransferase-like enzyme